jgi:ABC-type bacteriocin/lantibiotic exporter with double-glycine peptidase domain
LILDEATSSLDQSTEKAIVESISFLKRKKTLIIITHRLSTVKNCDKIFCVDKGKIIKQGLPEEILNFDNWESKQKSSKIVKK